MLNLKQLGKFSCSGDCLSERKINLAPRLHGKPAWNALNASPTPDRTVKSQERGRCCGTHEPRTSISILFPILPKLNFYNLDSKVLDFRSQFVSRSHYAGKKKMKTKLYFSGYCPTVCSSRKWSFSKTLLNGGELIWKYRLSCVVLWTKKNLLKTEFFKNGDIAIIMRLPCQSFNGRWLLLF